MRHLPREVQKQIEEIPYLTRYEREKPRSTSREDADLKKRFSSAS